jgi:quercetin dioxygenase-like cupin family protein
LVNEQLKKFDLLTLDDWGIDILPSERLPALVAALLPYYPRATGVAGRRLVLSPIPVLALMNTIHESSGRFIAHFVIVDEPGARAPWHTHPAGQVLIVTSGVGRVQQWGRPVQEIRPGDVIVTPPGVKHWHGAAPSTAMTHLAIQESVAGKNVAWMEKVNDEQYGK